MRAGLIGFALLTAAAGASTQAAPTAMAPSGAIAAALADPARADAATDDDRRKAAAVLAFAGVKPGDTVVDFLPGDNYYWTRIFSGIVGARGHVYAVWPPTAAAHVTSTADKVAGWHLANTMVVAPPPGDLPIKGGIDLFWTVENYHDVANKGEAATAALNAAAYKALKPGGIYVVIDHADAAGTGTTGGSTKHRIDPAVVKAEVQKAGFTFVGESSALRNPADDHSLKIFDPAIRGHTDQFAYKFRKG